MGTERIKELLQKVNTSLATGNVNGLSKIEFDLALQSLRELYDALDTLRNQPKQELPQKEEVKPAPVIKRVLNPNENLLSEEPAVKKQPAIVSEPVIVKKEEPVIKQEIKQPVKHEIKPVETTSRSSINESVQSSSTLNEKHKGASKEVHRKLSTRPLKDLIDLNKKFTLLNDLFKGNAEAFSAAIHHIDSSPTLEDAEHFIKNELSTNYFWDEKSQSVRMFMKLVKQKFGEE